MFGTTSTRRKSNVSRTSTIDTQLSRGSFDDRRGRSVSPLEGLPEGGARGLGIPLAAQGQSELDLNERLDLARKNSRTMAAMSPVNGRLGAKSVSELRSQVEVQSVEIDRTSSKLGAKSVADLRLVDSVMSEAEQDVRKACKSSRAGFAIRKVLRLVRSGSPTPLSPTAPLRVRNKTPSPTRALYPDKTPRALPDPIAIPPNPYTDRSAGAKLPHHTPSLDGVLASSLPVPPSLNRGLPVSDPIALSPIQHSTSVVDAALAVHASPLLASPRQLPNAPIQPTTYGPTAPLSPRPHGPRSPVPKSIGTLNGIGSARTKLRVVSGNGRRVSVGRETIPLKGMEESESQTNPTAPMLSKRQHSEDQITPRKRSPTRSPLQPRLDDQEANTADPSKALSGSLKRNQRRTSGHNTPRKASGGRRVSAGTLSITSQHTGTSVGDGSLAVVDHPSTVAAVEASKKKVADSRAAVKRLKADIQVLRKQLGGEVARTPSTYSNGSLPRSPHRRNIHVSCLLYHVLVRS